VEGRGIVLAALVAGTGIVPGPGVIVPGNASATSYGPGGAGAVPDQAVTLEALWTAQGPFDLVKLDTEGMELDILRSAAEWLGPSPAVLWLECNPDGRSLDLAALLLEWGRPVYYYAWPAFHSANWAGSADPILPCAYEAGLLALPVGGAAPVLQPGVPGMLMPIDSLDALRAALWRTPRWGLPEWENVGLPAMQALAGRYLCGEEFETFLQAGLDPPTPSWDQLRAALARAEAAEAALARLTAASAKV